MGRLDGRVAIVTGAGGGIGREHALLLGREGAAVVVDDLGSRTGSDAAAVAAEIRAAGGTAAATNASATWDGAAEIVQTALDEFGGVDILVNNATAGRNDDLWRYSEAEWDLTMAVNLKGYYALMRESIPHMARRGGGAIVNTSSASGFGHPSHGAYAAAKEGLIGLTRTAAMELGRFGIRCNAIRPLAITVQVQEYNAHSAPWRPLMDATMGRPSEELPADVIAPREDRAARRLAVHRRGGGRQRAHLPRVRRPDLAPHRAQAEDDDRTAGRLDARRSRPGRPRGARRRPPQPLDAGRPPRSATVSRPRRVTFTLR